MLFNSIEYLTFFFAVSILYYVIPHQFRRYLLLISSIIFYISFIPAYIFIIAFIIMVDYFTARAMENSSMKKKKYLLIESIILNLSILFIFKYFNFFSTNITRLAQLIHWNYSIGTLELVLPLGISFYIFKSLSYVIDVYNNNQQAEKNFIVYALFISFFPELPSGPIDRAQNLIPQFYEKHDFNYDDITGGLKLMAWGFFKKLVIADRLAILVNQIYGNLTDYTGIPLIIAVVFFAFQIYCDFSGYTDIAIGSGMVLGFKLMNNFDRPYFSRSISEFWRKWHISLTSWLRDYVFMPVAYSVSSRIKKRSYLGVKKESLSYAVATFVTMLIAGLWHGAGWTFVIWGIIFAVYMIFSHFTKKARKKISGALGLNNVPRIHDYFKLLITFCLLCLVWIFFRAYNLNDALYVITHMFSGIGLKLSGNKLGPSNFDMALSIILIFTLLFTEALLKKDETITDFIARKPAWLRWTVYYTLLFLILAFGEFGYNKFIYFQF